MQCCAGEATGELWRLNVEGAFLRQRALQCRCSLLTGCWAKLESLVAVESGYRVGEHWCRSMLRVISIHSARAPPIQYCCRGSYWRRVTRWPWLGTHWLPGCLLNHWLLSWARIPDAVVALDAGTLRVGWRGSVTERVLELLGYRAGLGVVVVLLIYW